MVLAFNQRFVKPILEDKKIHTIRADVYNRWHAGRSIQMATGVRTKAYNQFNVDRPDLQTCISTQAITINYITYKGFTGPSVRIDGQRLTAIKLHMLAVADGFDNIDQFFAWFNTDFEGKIIHWTDKRY